MRKGWLLALGLVCGATALAADTEPLEVVVTADPFARWDDTRWRVDVQTGVPYPATFYAEFNRELQVVSYDVRAVFRCQLGERLTRRVREVDCLIESAAVSAAPWVRSPRAGQEVLDETAARMSGLAFVLQVTADGRVASVGLVDEPQTNRRVNVIYENIRQIVRRFMVGFHLRAPAQYVVGEEWIERNSALFSLPVFRHVTTATAPFVPSSGELYDYRGGSPLTGSGTFSVGGVSGVGAWEAVDEDRFLGLSPSAYLSSGRHPLDILQAPASMGRSTVVHRMDAYKDMFLVQSSGHGTVDVGADQTMFFTGDLSAVSVYEPDNAIMRERVWSIQLMPSASSPLANGPAGWPYWQVGRLEKLPTDAASEVGASRLVAPPRTERGQLPPWPAMR